MLTLLVVLATQTGRTAITDTIASMVTGPGGTPLAGAIVQAMSAVTRLSRWQTSDAAGRFTIYFPGRAQYQLTAYYFGLVRGLGVGVGGLGGGGGTVMGARRSPRGEHPARPGGFREPDRYDSRALRYARTHRRPDHTAAGGRGVDQLVRPAGARARAQHSHRIPVVSTLNRAAVRRDDSYAGKLRFPVASAPRPPPPPPPP